MELARGEAIDEALAGALFALAYRVAFRMVGSRADAEDVAQESIARACASWRRIRDYPDAWVTKVSANLAIDVIRRRRRDRTRLERVSPGAGSAIANDAERVDLVAAIERLPRRQREVVVMRYLADLPLAAVAEQLGCSVGAVKQHSSRGLQALRERLGAAAWMEAT